MNFARRLDQAILTVSRPVRNASLRSLLPRSPWLNERSVEYAFTFSRLAGRGTGKLLDIGTGKSAFPALVQLAGWQVVAVDNIVDFWPRGPLNIRWGMFNEYFPVQDRDIVSSPLTERFDVVTCISTFEHVHDRPALFAAMAQCLKEHGEIVLTTPYREQGGDLNVYLRPNSDAFGRDIPYICQVLDRTELDALCEANCLHVLDIEYWRFWSGEYWSEGRCFARGERASSDGAHDLACIAIGRR